MAEKPVSRTTAAQLIVELHKLPPDAEVVTSISGWEGPELGPVTIIEKVVMGVGVRFDEPAMCYDKDGRTVYVLDAPG